MVFLQGPYQGIPLGYFKKDTFLPLKSSKKTSDLSHKKVFELKFVVFLWGLILGLIPRQGSFRQAYRMKRLPQACLKQKLNNCGLFYRVLFRVFLWGCFKKDTFLRLKSSRKTSELSHKKVFKLNSVVFHCGPIIGLILRQRSFRQAYRMRKLPQASLKQKLNN